MPSSSLSMQVPTVLSLQGTRSSVPLQPPQDQVVLAQGLAILAMKAKTDWSGHGQVNHRTRLNDHALIIILKSNEKFVGWAELAKSRIEISS